MRDIRTELNPERFILLLTQARSNFRFAAHEGISPTDMLLAMLCDIHLNDIAGRAGKKIKMSVLDMLLGKPPETKTSGSYRALTLEEAAAL